jgi:glycosyltransferase involved in cell wall biosynthesis
MRIGLLIYGSLNTLSGGYLYDRKLVEYLLVQGDRVEIISLAPKNYARNLADNFSTSLIQCLKSLQLDILLQDELNHPSLFWLNRRLRREVDCPLVSIVHHLRSSETFPAWQNLFYRWVEKSYLASVDGYVFNSRSTRQAVEAMVGKVKAALVAFPAGDRLRPSITETQISERAFQSGPMRLVFVGNLIPRKNLHTLIKALTNLPNNSWSLSVAGRQDIDKKYTQRLYRLSEQNDLQDQIHFHGPLPDRSLANLLWNSHVMVVPSTYEGYGIAYLEGMGFGLPAFGASAGGASEIIDHGKNGYLIQPGDTRSLASHLECLANDRALLAKMGVSARAHYSKHPTWKKTTGRIRRFLCTLL